MSSVLEDVVEYDVKKHLYVKEFVKYLNRRTKWVKITGGFTHDKKCDIRDEYAKFLNRSKLNKSDSDLNADIIDTVRRAIVGQKYQTSLAELYSAVLVCYNETSSRLTNHLEKRPRMFKLIYNQYFPSTAKVKDEHQF